VSGERGANAKCVGVANFIVRNHATNLLAAESAAIENRFAFLAVRALFFLFGTIRRRLRVVNVNVNGFGAGAAGIRAH